MKVLLIDNYDSFTFNLYQAFEELGAPCQVVRNDQVSVSGIRKMRPDRIVVSPGPGRPENAGVSMEVIRLMGDSIPILGVCLGHQAIGQVFGGQVKRARKGVHGKTSEIYHQNQGIFKGLKNPFSATRYHSLMIDRATLPLSLLVTSETQEGIVMGVQHRDFPIYGVQFHPESILTLEGKALLQNFLGAT